MTEFRFAAIGLNHNHIYGQVNCLLRAGAELVAFHADEDDLAADLRREVSRRRSASPTAAAILEDASIGRDLTSRDPRRARGDRASRPCATART